MSENFSEPKKKAKILKSAPVPKNSEVIYDDD
jgi:hypothetical protein